MDEKSEYGGPHRPNTLPKGKDEKMPLTPGEQLRLLYQTGQMTDIREKPLENWRDLTGPRRTD